MSLCERIFNQIVKPWFVVLFLLLIICLIVWVDLPIAERLRTLNLQKSMPWLKILTNLGLGVFYIGSLAALALIFRFIFHNKLWEDRTWFLWLCVTIPSLLCLVFKVLLGRARPDLWFAHHAYGFYGLGMTAQYWSFPSGHTSTIMGLAFGCSVLFSRFCILFVLLGLFVAASRILLTQHYLSDVLFASYLAFVSVGLLYQFKLQTRLLDR